MDYAVKITRNLQDCDERKAHLRLRIPNDAILIALVGKDDRGTRPMIVASYKAPVSLSETPQTSSHSRVCSGPDDMQRYALEDCTRNLIHEIYDSEISLSRATDKKSGNIVTSKQRIG